MWEAYGLGDEDLLWAGTNLRGGIAGQQTGTCGAVASAGVCLGFRHRHSLADKKGAEKARNAAYEEARELVGEFMEKHGSVTCLDLVGVDLSDEEARDRAREAGLFEKKCHHYIRDVVEKLYELEEKRRPPRKTG